MADTVAEPDEQRGEGPRTSGIATAYTTGQANSYDAARFESPGGQQVHRAEAAQLESAYRRVPQDSRVLEVGSGTGRFLPLGENLGHRLTGLDASVAMMSRSPSVATDLVAGEAGRLPFASAAFDFVYAIRLLSQTESNEYAEGVIGEMLRVTAPGGHCLIECLSADRVTPSSTPQIRLTVEEIAAACERHGAVVVDVQGRFVLGMTPMRRAPKALAAPMASLDAVLSRLSPRRCSRIYVLAMLPD